jgi:hypothetical protein
VVVRARGKCLAAIALVIIFSREAGAEPVHLKSASKVETAKGSKLELPPGYFFDEAEKAALDVELKRLQDQETRLAAENKSLRESADGISFGWYALGSAIVAGFALGYYIGK